MTDHEQELARLHAFILRMAERLAAASEVLGNRAERRRGQQGELFHEKAEAEGEAVPSMQGDT